MKGTPFPECEDWDKPVAQPPAHVRFRPTPPLMERIGCDRLYHAPTASFLDKLRHHKEREQQKLARRKAGMGRPMIADENRTLYL